MDAISDFKCPRCLYELTAQTAPPGKVWVCDTCNGRAVGIALLRQLFAEDSIDLLWKNAVEGNGRVRCDCPACHELMHEVSAGPDLRVDVCCRCHFVWLDAGEIERFTTRPPLPKSEELPEEAQEILGKALIGQVTRKAEAEALAERARNSRHLHLMPATPFDYIFWLLHGLRRY